MRFMVFFMLKIYFSLPKLFYFLRTSTCLNHPALSKKYDETVRDGLFKVCNVNVIVSLSTLTALPAETGGLGLYSESILALLTFLAPTFGASDCEWLSSTFFWETLEDVLFTKPLENWLSWTNDQKIPLYGTQKNCTQPVNIKTAQDLISRLDDKRSKVFNAHQGNFGSQWLNVVPCKNLGLNIDNQQLRILIGLRLGANICVHLGSSLSPKSQAYLLKTISIILEKIIEIVNH